MSDHTPAPWPESPPLILLNSGYPYEVPTAPVRISAADYAHARRCVNFVARLEEHIVKCGSVRISWRFTDGVWHMHDCEVGDGADYADTLTDLLGGDDE